MPACPNCGWNGWLTVREVCDRTGKCDSTIRNWIFDGRLPNSIKEIAPGGYRYLIREDDLDAVLEGAA